MDLRELRIILRRNLFSAFLGFCICLAIGLSTLLLPDKTYASRSSVILTLAEESDTATGGSVQVVQFQLTAIEETVRSLRLREEARTLVPEEFARARVSVAPSTDASVLRIRGTGKSPKAVQAWVNATTEVLVNRRSFPGVELELLDAAPLKQRVVAPRPDAILPATIVFSVIGGLFSALLADRLRHAFDAKQAVRDRLGTTVLGEIPSVRALRKTRRPIIQLLADGSSPVLLTAFQTIRANVELRMLETGASSIAVTSHDSGAGKSMVTAGLAYAMASVDRDVLAIDADLRYPTLPDQLDVEPGPGLGDMAIQESLAASPQSTRHPKLRLLSAGLPAGQAADVVTTTLPRAIDDLRAPGRLLMIDSPPQLGAPESSLVASVAGYVILVLNSDAREMAALPASIQQIHESGAVLLGVILNRTPTRRLRRSLYRKGRPKTGPVRNRRDAEAPSRPIGSPADDDEFTHAEAPADDGETVAATNDHAE